MDSNRIEKEIIIEKDIPLKEEEEEKEDEKEDENYIGIEKKLGDLILRGWTMLADSCPLESCRCPLMRSPDGQKYCVNCEMWQFDNKKRQKKKFTELIPLHGKQNITIKHMDLVKPLKKKKLNDSFDNILKDKLLYLAEKLNNENDLRNIEEILKAMNLMMDTIEHYYMIKKSN
jgi:uncharacterized Zn finger protein (UPF0148 family)